MRKSAWVIVRNSGKILILKRSNSSNNSGQWNFPGGSIDPGEVPIISAYRELKEEAGLNIKLFEVCTIHTANGLLYYFNGIARTKNVKIDKESSKFKWVEVDYLLKNKSNFHKSINTFFNLNNENSIKITSNNLPGGNEYITLEDHRSGKTSFLTFLYSENTISVTALSSPLKQFMPFLASYLKTIKNPNLIVSDSLLPAQKLEFDENWQEFMQKKGKSLNLSIKEYVK